MSYCFDQHRETVKKYHLSDQAKQDLQELKRQEQERRETMFKDAEEAIESASSTDINLSDFESGDLQISLKCDFLKISSNPGDSKDIDNGLRLTLLLHIVKHGIEHVLKKKPDNETIPLEISEVTFQRAFELVTVLKTQLKLYKNIVQTAQLESTTKEAILSASKRAETSIVDIRYVIAKIPGPFVTSSMICR